MRKLVHLAYGVLKTSPASSSSLSPWTPAAVPSTSSGGDVILLGEIVQEVTGELLDRYAAEQLTAPPGISEYEWDFIDEETVQASGDVK